MSWRSETVTAAARVALASALVITAAAAFEEEYLPLDDSAYPLLERLRTLGAPIRVDLAVRPITRGAAAEAVRATREAVREGVLELDATAAAHLAWLGAELAPELGEDPPGRYHLEDLGDGLELRWAFRGEGRVVASPEGTRPEDAPVPARARETVEPRSGVTYFLRLRPELAGRVGKLLVQGRLNLRYRFGASVGETSFGPGRGEAEFTEDDDDPFSVKRTFDSIARFVASPVAIEVGRTHVRWGPGRRGTLLVSDAAPPMDFARVVGRAGRFGFANMAAQLRTDAGERYLVAHRLAYVTPHLTLALSESVIFGNRSFDLAYLSPFQLFVVVEDNVGALDNNILGGDVRWRPVPGLELYTEAILDDWNLRDWFDTFANKIAVQIGLSKAGLPGLPSTDLDVEYAIVDQFTYTHRVPINVASHFGGPVGHRIGTDADLLSATITHWHGPRLQLFGRLEQERHGEGDITIDHTTRDDDLHHFLTGTHERTRSVSVGLVLRSVRGIEVRAGAGGAWVRSFRNDPNAPRRASAEGEILVAFEL